MTLGMLASAGFNRAMASSGDTPERQLRGAIDAAIAVGGEVFDGVVRNLAVADDRLDVVGRGDDGVEQPDFGRRALDAAGDDIIADLVRPENDQEGAGGEIAEQPRPGGTNGKTDTGELHGLAEFGIVELDLAAHAGTDMNNGNLIGLVSSFTKPDGSQHAMADVSFARDVAPAQPDSPAPAML